MNISLTLPNIPPLSVLLFPLAREVIAAASSDTSREKGGTASKTKLEIIYWLLFLFMYLRCYLAATAFPADVEGKCPSLIPAAEAREKARIEAEGRDKEEEEEEEEEEEDKKDSLSSSSKRASRLQSIFRYCF